MPTYRAYISHITRESSATDSSNVLGDTPSTYGWLTSGTGYIQFAFDRTVIANISSLESLVGITWNFEIGTTAIDVRMFLGMDTVVNSQSEYGKWFGPTDYEPGTSDNTSYQVTGIGPSTLSQLKSEGIGGRISYRYSRLYRAYVDIETLAPVTPESTLYADSHIDGTAKNPENVLGAPDGVGTTHSTWVDWDSRFGMEDPPAALAGSQGIIVRWRKSSGSGAPSAYVSLYENGTFIRTLVSDVTVSSTSFVDSSLLVFDASEITDPNAVEIEVDARKGQDCALQVDAISWLCSHESLNKVNVWTGTEWLVGAKAWDGSAWKPVKVWTGTEWVL